MKIDVPYIPVMLFVLLFSFFILINISTSMSIANDIDTVLATIPKEKLIGAFAIALSLTLLILGLLSYLAIRGLEVVGKKVSIAFILLGAISTAVFFQNLPPFAISFPNGQAQNIGGWIVQLDQIGAERDIDMLAKDLGRLGGWDYIGYDESYIKYKGKTTGYYNGKFMWSYNFDAYCNGKKTSASIIYYPDTHLTEGGDRPKLTFYCGKPIILERVGRIDRMGEADPYKFVFDIYVQSCRAQDTTLCATAWLKEKPKGEEYCKDGETRTIKCQYSGITITTHICKKGLWESTNEKCPEGISGNWDIDGGNWGSKDEGDHEEEGDNTQPPQLPPDWEQPPGGEAPESSYPPTNGECKTNSYLGADGKCYCNIGYMFLDGECQPTPKTQAQEWILWTILFVVGLGIAGVVGLTIILTILRRR